MQPPILHTKGKVLLQLKMCLEGPIKADSETTGITMLPDTSTSLGEFQFYAEYVCIILSMEFYNQHTHFSMKMKHSFWEKRPLVVKVNS